MPTVKIPKCWQGLLALEEFEESTPNAQRCAIGDKHNNNPLPFRYDERSVTHAFEDGWEAEVKLCSGGTNYWMEVVLFNEKGIEQEVTEPFHEVMNGGEIFFEKFPHTLELEVI